MSGYVVRQKRNCLLKASFKNKNSSLQNSDTWMFGTRKWHHKHSSTGKSRSTLFFISLWGTSQVCSLEVGCFRHCFSSTRHVKVKRKKNKGWVVRWNKNGWEFFLPHKIVWGNPTRPHLECVSLRTEHRFDMLCTSQKIQRCRFVHVSQNGCLWVREKFVYLFV